MGCLNADQAKGKGWHTFGNIHLSGPCSRRCYFCIGQHMMALDSLNNLDEWPLRGLFGFLGSCRARKVSQIYVTGSNTDPLLYEHTAELAEHLHERGFGPLGIRTNGVASSERRRDILQHYSRGSVTICSLDPKIHKKMMGVGEPLDVPRFIADLPAGFDLKVNIVLGPWNASGIGEGVGEGIDDLLRTLTLLNAYGIRRVNLRQPYGQPEVENPMAFAGFTPIRSAMGMPVYQFEKMEVTHWDVHYVEVESVNLYANGHVSFDYPISRGHDPVNGFVLPQSAWPGGRIRDQWVTSNA